MKKYSQLLEAELKRTVLLACAVRDNNPLPLAAVFGNDAIVVLEYFKELVYQRYTHIAYSEQVFAALQNDEKFQNFILERSNQ